MQQSNTQQPVSQPKKAMLGFVFSLAGAILILLRGIVRIVVGDVITFYGSDMIRHRFLAGIALNILGGIAVLFAILIIVGAYFIYNWNRSYWRRNRLNLCSAKHLCWQRLVNRLDPWRNRRYPRFTQKITKQRRTAHV